MRARLVLRSRIRPSEVVVMVVVVSKELVSLG